MAHHHSSVVDPHLHYLPPSALPQSHLGSGLKRNADSAGLDMMSGTPSSTGGISSDEDSDVKPPLGERTAGTGRGKSTGPDPATGKKTKGRVKIKMEFIDNKLRRYTTFSKRKTGIMKKVGQGLCKEVVCPWGNLFTLGIPDLPFFSFLLPTESESRNYYIETLCLRGETFLICTKARVEAWPEKILVPRGTEAQSRHRLFAAQEKTQDKVILF